MSKTKKAQKSNQQECCGKETESPPEFNIFVSSCDSDFSVSNTPMLVLAATAGIPEENYNLVFFVVMLFHGIWRISLQHNTATFRSGGIIKLRPFVTCEITSKNKSHLVYPTSASRKNLISTLFITHPMKHFSYFCVNHSLLI